MLKKPLLLTERFGVHEPAVWSPGFRYQGDTLTSFQALNDRLYFSVFVEAVQTHQRCGDVIPVEQYATGPGVLTCYEVYEL